MIKVVRINVLILRQAVCLMGQNIYVLARLASMMTMDSLWLETAEEVG